MYRCLDVPCGPLQGKLRVSRGEFHGAPVLAGLATPRGPCAAELRVSLRGCAAVPRRKLGAARPAQVAGDSSHGTTVAGPVTFCDMDVRVSKYISEKKR